MDAIPARAASGRRAALLATAVYLGVALWAMRVVLPAPSRLLAYQADLEGQNWLHIVESDQRFVAWGISRNARILLTEPGRLFEGETCFPAHREVTLGEHMFGEGLLGMLPYAVSGDPLVTYNAVVIMSLWLAGVSMYALVYHWTGSGAGAFVAGLMFAFHPHRVGDPGHPFVHGNLWTPLALLFAHRLFARRRWRDAAGLTLFLDLQLLESFYPVLALALLGGLYGVFLMVRHARQLPSLLPKLLAVGVGVGGMTAFVFGPYLQTRAAWGVLGDRITLPNFMQSYLPGGPFFPGWVAVVLATVGLADRLWRWRRSGRDDPRLVLLAAGFLVAWTASVGFVLGGVFFPSPYLLLVRVIPGLDAVRGVGNAGIGLHVPVALTAGYGVWVLVARRGAVVRGLVTVALAAAVLVEFFHPPATRASFGHPVEFKAVDVRPPDAALALYRTAGPGAVIDLPFAYDLVGLLRLMAYYITWGSFHHRPLAACYNSFVLPIRDEVAALVARLPDPRAADALYALGFRTVMLHGEVMLGRDYVRVSHDLARLAEDGRRIVQLDQALPNTIFRLQSPVPVEVDLDALAASADAGPAVAASAPEAEIEFHFRNRAAATYRHPDPIEPTALLARWTASEGGHVLEVPVRALLPLALARGEESVRTVKLPVPPAAGEYEVTLAPAVRPELVLARRRVRVAP